MSKNLNFRMETFRCSCTERGRRCVCDFTRVNAFSFTIATLAKKYKVVTMQTVADNAICPGHARILRSFRRDMVPLNEVVSELSALLQKGRRENAEWRYKREARLLSEPEATKQSVPRTLMGETLSKAIRD